MTEVTPHPLKTQGFHHFFILLFYDHPANDVTIMKEGHPEAGTPLFWWVRLELNQRCFRCHGFTDRCDVSVGSSRPRFVGSNEPLFVGKPEANR